MTTQAKADAPFERSVDVLPLNSGVTWGASVRCIHDGHEVASLRPHDVLSTASVGKLLLLIESAERIRNEPDWANHPLRRTPADDVADSGLWQHLTTDTLPVGDIAVLIAAHSDNLATNVLLREVGLDWVQRRGMALGLEGTVLLDQVRDERGPFDPARLSHGTAAELSRLAATMELPGQLHEATRNRVIQWLRVGTDLSMVPASLGLDPLSHTNPERGWCIWNKTGRDAGVLADVGVLRSQKEGLAFALIANWEPDDTEPSVVLDAMRRFGAVLADAMVAKDSSFRPEQQVL